MRSVNNRSRIVALWRQGLTYSEIAARVGTTRSAVAGHVRRHRNGRNGVRPFRKYTTEEIDAAVIANGNNMSAAGRALGISQTTVRTHTSIRPDPKAPNRAWDLSTRQVCDMIERSRLTVEEIADLAGVSEKTLMYWRRGRNPGYPHYIQAVREAIKREETY